VYELVGQRLGVLLGAVLAAGDAGEDQPGLAILTGKRLRGRWWRGPRRTDLRHMRRRPQLGNDVDAGGASGGAVRAHIGGDSDEQLHVAPVELVGQQLPSLPRLRRRIVEAPGREVLGDGEAEHRCGDHDKQCYRDDAPRRGDGQRSDSTQHVRRFAPGRRTSSQREVISE
jgi:hypothetical protein